MAAILVTGAGGRVGRATVERLIASGHHVSGVDRNAGLVAGIAVAEIDLCDRVAVAEVVVATDTVVHLAAIPEPMAGRDAEVFANNVVSAYNVLDALTAAGVNRLVNLSSECVYGFGYPRHDIRPQRLPLAEDSPLIPSDPYGLGKVVVETAIDAAIRANPRLVAVSLRSAWVLGEDEYRCFDTTLGVDVRRTGGLWAYVDIDDLVDVIEAACTVETPGHAVLNVCSPENLVGEPLGQLSSERFGGGVYVAEPHSLGSGISADRLESVLGYRAGRRWQDGVARLRASGSDVHRDGA